MTPWHAEYAVERERCGEAERDPEAPRAPTGWRKLWTLIAGPARPERQQGGREVGARR